MNVSSIPCKVPTLREYGPVVIDLREKEGIRGDVSERSRWRVHLLCAPFIDLPIDQITRPMVRAWCIDMRAKEASDTRGKRLLSTQTVARSKALLSAILGRAIEEERLDSNACIGFKLRKRADEFVSFDPWTYGTVDEQRALIFNEKIHPWHRIAIRFALGTGCRQGEQMLMPIANVHLEGANPFIYIQFGSVKKLPDGTLKLRAPKNGKPRKVQLFGDGLIAAREALAYIADKPNPYRLLFPSSTGGHRGVGKPLGREKNEDGVWEEAWKTAKRIVGIERRFRWHDLRHTFATNLVSGVLDRRWTLEEIRPLLGHSSIVITQRYAHLAEHALEAAARETSLILPPTPIAPATERDISVPDECFPEMPPELDDVVLRLAKTMAEQMVRDRVAS